MILVTKLKGKLDLEIHLVIVLYNLDYWSDQS